MERSMKTWWPTMDPYTFEPGYSIYDSATKIITKHKDVFKGKWSYGAVRGCPVREITDA